MIEENEGSYAIRFDTITRFLQKKYQFERAGLSIEEQKQEISLRVDTAERSLRGIVRRNLKASLNEEGAKQAFLDAMEKNASAQGHVASARGLKYKQLFDPSVNTGCFFSVLIDAIVSNYKLFENVFEEPVATVEKNLRTLNKSRRCPSHSIPENAEKWTDEDFMEFRGAMNWLDVILDDYD